MKFRYRVKYDPWYGWEHQQIEIQKSYNLFFGIHIWFPKETNRLSHILAYLNPNAYVSSPEEVYDELNKYSSMKEIMEKYIVEMAKLELTNETIQNKLERFILADGDGWTTVEVKENEANGRNSSW